MTHTRSLFVGAILGSALSFATMGFIACQKSNDKNSAQAGTKPADKTAKTPALPPQSKEELDEPVATIDGYVISVGAFQDNINKQSPYIRARYTSLERKKEFLDNMIRFEVIANEAQRQGFDKDPDVIRTMKQVMIQKLMKQEFDSRVKPEDVTDDEMKKFYEDHKDEYNKPEEVRASAIILKDKATADKAAAEAKGAGGADNKGFRDLVMKYSQDEPTKGRGGDLRYFSMDSTEVPPEVAKAAFDIAKTGDVAGPIATKQGYYYVVKQTGRRKALAKSFDEVKRQIQNRIFRDKRTKAMEDFVVDLKGKAKIQINEDKLAKVRIDTSGAGPNPPSAPGGVGAEEGANGDLGAEPIQAPQPVVPTPGPGGKPQAPAPTPAPQPHK